MKNILLLGAISLYSLTTHALELEGYNITIPKDVIAAEEQSEATVVKKRDENGVFYEIEMQSVLIIPDEIIAAAGIGNKSAEVEIFTGINAIRLVAGDHSVHIPYGARVRVAINEDKTWYIEYAYQKVAMVAGNKDGLFEQPHTFSIIKLDRDSQIYYGCGISRTIHNPWSDESHAPEKNYDLICKIGKRF